jgi:hypothetical protein
MAEWARALLIYGSAFLIGGSFGLAMNRLVRRRARRT